MRSVGYNDLQARSAYQPWIENQGGRFIAYVGHHGGSALNPMTGQIEPNGTSIIDVTNPTSPKYLKHIPGPAGAGEAGGAQMTRICSGDVLPQGESGKYLDVEKLLTGPAEPTEENLLFPQITRVELGALQGAYTTLPLLNVRPPEFGDFTEGTERNLIAIVNESIGNECREPAQQQMYLYDITTETEPHGVSNYHVDPRGSDVLGNFCDRGGRFGAHSSHENMNNPYGNKVLFLAYFNAGVRAVDVRNAGLPASWATTSPGSTSERTNAA